MDLVTTVVTPLMGGAIGYFTNWIAIKMLFRPHRAKFLFGLQLPFTPGLIPKERGALAKKVGETTAQHVLTAEVLAASFASDEFNAKLLAVSDDVFRNLRQNNQTLGSLLALFDADPSAADDFLIDLFSAVLQKETVQAAVAGALTDGLTRFLASPQTFIDLDALFETLEETAVEKGAAILQSEAAADQIRRYVAARFQSLAESRRPVSDWLPASFLQVLTDLLQSQLNQAGGALEKLFEEHPNMDEKLRQTVHRLADEQFGKLLGIFFNYDKIYESLKKNLITYLSDPETQAVLTGKMTESLQKIRETDAADLFARLSLPEGFDNEIAEKLIAFLQAPERGGDMAKALSFLRGKLGDNGAVDLYAWILRIDPDFSQRLAALMTAVVRDLLFPAVTGLARQNAPFWRERVCQVKIADWMAGLSEPQEAKAKALTQQILAAALKRGGGYIANNIDIGGIIEDRINRFEVSEAEAIILSVVNRELSAITWLGGLLGFVIGLIPMLTSLLGA